MTDTSRKPSGGVGIIKDIIIIAGGPSVADYPAETLTEYGHVIGVNEASVIHPCHIALSMDRLWMEGRYEQLQRQGTPTFFRKCAWKKNIQWPHLTLFEGDIHKDGLSETRGVLYGNNSGICAINLAYHLRPKNIFLFGFDMRGGYFHKGYEWKANNEKNYKGWISRFGAINAQLENADIKVYNVSPQSAITDFEKIDWDVFKKRA